MRETSIDVYHKIESEGLLSKLRFTTYKTIFKHGPLTMSEAAHIMRNGSKSVSPRFAELLRVGVIYEAGKKICSISGRNVIAWEVTKRLPVKPEKPKKTKCPHCKGTGQLNLAQQMRLF